MQNNPEETTLLNESTIPSKLPIIITMARTCGNFVNVSSYRIRNDEQLIPKSQDPHFQNSVSSPQVTPNEQSRSKYGFGIQTKTVRHMREHLSISKNLPYWINTFMQVTIDALNPILQKQNRDFKEKKLAPLRIKLRYLLNNIKSMFNRSEDVEFYANKILRLLETYVNCERVSLKTSIVPDFLMKIIGEIRLLVQTLKFIFPEDKALQDAEECLKSLRYDIIDKTSLEICEDNANTYQIEYNTNSKIIRTSGKYIDRLVIYKTKNTCLAKIKEDSANRSQVTTEQLGDGNKVSKRIIQTHNMDHYQPFKLIDEKKVNNEGRFVYNLLNYENHVD